MNAASQPSQPDDRVQRTRARQYAICTHALQYDRISDGAEGVFDQALTNGLAAIVAHSWPGKESDAKGRVLSAAALLKVVKGNGKPAANGIVHVLHDPVGPEFGDPFPFDLGGPVPNFTKVAVSTLLDAIDATQAIRHARDLDEQVTRVITADHLHALVELDYHPALHTLSDESLNRHEQTTEDADRAEAARAAEYLEALGEDERERRAAINWVELYAWETPEESCAVEECPVCYNVSLVAPYRDGRLGEVGIGHCIVCSYYRSADAADSIALDIQVRRAVDRAD